ncbi:MAG: hypothetical protein JSV62_05965 [Promethearchaeota archaeon]|nr:MAG: hypothetical protein JSV62_05965 [Candidatus Lokiarchaeota archaeon]
MKKGYIIFVILMLLIGVLLTVYPFVTPDVQIIILIIVISIPVIFVVLLFLSPFILTLPFIGRIYPKESVDYHRPIVRDRKAFLEHQPFICDKCSAFTDTYREYCENCGVKDSLRIAKKKDYDQFIKKR